ncbi:MAG: AAA family ATPase [Chitinispirillales bacterium]|jgi:predicted AAA+ superfamily ATPase|nr:AAA family ATPase [Chitinispirillales bacterium]
MERKFTDFLLKWKESHRKECLLVKGARQVGKTYIVEDFGKKHYESVISLNFFERPEHKEIFAGGLSAKDILQKLSIHLPEFNFIENHTLLFLDEIQECPQARTALKFLAQGSGFDCIASGSMLGVAYKEIASIPVGYEYQVEMFSMDFEEFLWAKGVNKDAIEYIKGFYSEKKKIPDDVNETMFKYLREYMVVGGMPAVVKTFVETGNFVKVHELQQKILSSYLDDIAKYASAAEKPKARNAFLSIPNQLAKENKKFQFSVIEKGGSARKYENSLEWLRDAGLIKFCVNVSTPQFPIVAYSKKNWFKVYLMDIGMLTAMYGFEMKQAIIKNTLAGHAKGGIYENLIADIFVKKNIPLYFYKPENNAQEIEFLLTKETDIIPVEVKSGNNATVSLNRFLEEFAPPFGIKLIAGNAGFTENKVTLPLYMALFIAPAGVHELFVSVIAEKGG